MWRPVFYEARIERGDDAAILAVRGELDLTTERLFRHQLEELVAGSPAAVVDLSEVTYLDLSTIRCLEHYASIARQRGGQLVIVNPSRHIRRVFDILRLDRHLQIAASRREALEWLRPPTILDPP